VYRNTLLQYGFGIVTSALQLILTSLASEIVIFNCELPVCEFHRNATCEMSMIVDNDMLSLGNHMTSATLSTFLLFAPGSTIRCLKMFVSQSLAFKPNLTHGYAAIFA
jgi:hypothetical protein